MSESNPTPAVRRAHNSTPPRAPADRLPAWDLVLLNDDEHSYNYITTMLCDLFWMKREQAVAVAATVIRAGRAVCWTSHREHAEFKREQVRSFGLDALVEGSAGPMRTVLEPAPCAEQSD